MGLCLAISILCQTHGIQLAPAAYLIALKRTSLIISVFYGGLWLREGHFPARLMGSALMTGGIAVIAFKGS